MRAWRGTGAALLGAAAVSVAACTDVSTDPQVPLSLQFDSLPAFAVVVGDTMRGGNLLPARIPVRAFNSSGDTVSESLISIIGIDTTSTKAFTVISGLRLVGTVETAAVRIVAQAGSLQSQTQTFAVVARPTALAAAPVSKDSIVYDFTDSTTRFADVSAKLTRKVGDSTEVALNGLRVRFGVVSFTTSILDSVRVISPSGGRTIESALMAGGVATVRVKAYPKAGATGSGTVVLNASYTLLGAPVAGSPVSLTVRLVPFTVSP